MDAADFQIQVEGLRAGSSPLQMVPWKYIPVANPEFYLKDFEDFSMECQLLLGCHNMKLNTKKRHKQPEINIFKGPVLGITVSVDEALIKSSGIEAAPDVVRSLRQPGSDLAVEILDVNVHGDRWVPMPASESDILNHFINVVALDIIELLNQREKDFRLLCLNYRGLNSRDRESVPTVELSIKGSESFEWRQKLISDMNDIPGIRQPGWRIRLSDVVGRDSECPSSVPGRGSDPW
ncbi:hypothetical protein K490DRAFT_67769 [Saccharata proteae CBS 121410]|uniref:Uncharacterized protein n=1 Tax=Saccharata proteae CBS 121410 TaxID=1314787 RepID=A0A9P4LUW7_9PEZI|nr:hypothetical protein K490DRAFT_67769 [Saccharata proteae CBS 121410]